jgi:transposase
VRFRSPYCRIRLGKEPRQLQLDFALWTRELVREVIRRKFGVEYTLQAAGNILRDLGLSPQRPLVRAYEQDPEREGEHSQTKITP